MNDRTCVSLVNRDYDEHVLVEFDTSTFKITILKDFKKIKNENRLLRLNIEEEKVENPQPRLNIEEEKVENPQPRRMKQKKIVKNHNPRRKKERKMVENSQDMCKMICFIM